mmetsp:Transcript_23630/g.57938  ORF Transcript_23630/g.57938 Transcript_23630/m.57938 type:complete len:260 (-) Transcript_23630:154-933(-)
MKGNLQGRLLFVLIIIVVTGRISYYSSRLLIWYTCGRINCRGLGTALSRIIVAILGNVQVKLINTRSFQDEIIFSTQMFGQTLQHHGKDAHGRQPISFQTSLSLIMIPSNTQLLSRLHLLFRCQFVDCFKGCLQVVVLSFQFNICLFLISLFGSIIIISSSRRLQNVQVNRMTLSLALLSYCIPGIPPFDSKFSGWIGYRQCRIPLQKGQTTIMFQTESDPFALGIETIQIKEKNNSIVARCLVAHEGNFLAMMDVIDG